jgi:lysozyme
MLPLKIATWEALSKDQQLCLMDMYYNLGWPRLSKFKRMLKHIDDGKYDKAAEELLNSKYASQVGQRAKRNADLLRKVK